MKNVSDHVRTRLLRMRIDLQYTQREVSALMGLGQATVSHYEQGKQEFDIDQLSRLCGIYGVTLAAVLGDAPAHPPDKRFEKLKAAYLRMDETGREALLALMTHASPGQTRATAKNPSPRVTTRTRAMRDDERAAEGGRRR